MTADELWWQRVPAAEKLVKFTRDRILNCHSVQIFPDNSEIARPFWR